MVLVALALHGAWLGAFLGTGHDPRDLARIGYRFVKQSHESRVIKFDPTYHYPPNRDRPNGFGYDGQFSYYMALDFRHARQYMDNPPYRYSRVLYPATARALALGRPGAIPYTLILVNWIAVGIGTLAVAMF